MATFQWAGFGRLMSGLGTLADPDPTPLLEDWERVIAADNRRGILAGLDKDGNPLRAVTYRPVGGKPKRWTKKQEAKHRGRRGIFAGLGPYAIGFDNNLSSSQYRRLGGPPLAPRGASSRVITNLFTQHGRDPADSTWFAEGAWAEVVSTKGVPFLPFHFRGAGRLPVRDLRGVRPQGQREAVRALQRWGADLLKAIG